MINVTSFNIRCFGCDGLYDGKKGIEGRIGFLKSFFKKELIDSDIFILQEIMDISFLSDILPPGYLFDTYEHEYERHMNVVICYKKDFKNIDSKIIENTAIDNKRSRPAFYTKLEFNQSFLHIIGVHLKSGVHHTQNRLKQARAITDFIKTLPKDEVIIIGGDFNTHSKSVTHKEEHDIAYLEEIFLKADLKRVKNSNFTYYTPWDRECLDHIWVSRKNTIDKPLWTYDVEKHSAGHDSLYSIKTFYAELSDHLPIKTSVDLA